MSKRILFLILYSTVIFLPALGSVDRAHTQWFMLSLVNLLFYKHLFFFYRPQALSSSKPILVVIVLFLLLSLLSAFWAINPQESFVIFSHLVSLSLASYAFYMLLKQISFSQFSTVVVLLLGIEVSFYFYEFIPYYLNNPTYSRGAVEGIPGNIIITAFSILIKLPFLLYRLTLSSKLWAKLCYSVLLTSSLIIVFLSETRGAYLALLVAVFTYIIFILFFKDRLLRRRYLILPFSVFILSLIVSSSIMSTSKANVFERVSTVSDSSVSARLRYYAHAVDQIATFPFFGVGLGNWKIKSIDYDKANIPEYQVPYHAHNDFLEVGAELGFLGLILYASIILLLVKYLFYSALFNDMKSRFIVATFIFAMAVFSIDSFFNFPLHRPTIILFFIFIAAFVIKDFAPQNSVILRVNPLLIFSVLLVCICLSFLGFREYKAMKEQGTILVEFNNDQFNVPLDKAMSFIDSYPNMGPTTIPVISSKAYYLYQNKKYDSAIVYAKRGKLQNPYLFFEDWIISKSYEQKNNIDSAYYYAKRAFNGLPRNIAHSSQYFINLERLGKFQELDSVFMQIKHHNNVLDWLNYFRIKVASQNYDTLSLIKLAKEAKNIFPNNKDIKQQARIIQYGLLEVNSANNYDLTAREAYANKDYKTAIEAWERAFELIPVEYAYLQNIASSYINELNFKKGIYYLDLIPEKSSMRTGKYYFIKAKAYQEMEDKEAACFNFKKSIALKYNSSYLLYKDYCK